MKDIIMQMVTSLVNTELGSTAPTLTIPESETAAFESLVAQAAAGDIYPIVRCWSKDIDALRGFMLRIDQLVKYLPAIKTVLFVVNIDGEHENVTLGRSHNPNMTVEAVEMLRKDKHVQTPCLAVTIHQYSWTAGLNLPTALLDRIAQKANINSADISVLNMSFETNNIDAKEFATQVQQTGHVLSIKDSTYLTDITAFMQHMLRTIGNVKSEEELPDNIPYLGRNTLAVFTLKELIDLGGFNPECNAMGGMEDHEFWLRLLLKIRLEQKKLQHQLSNAGAGDTPDMYYIELYLKLTTTFGSDVPITYTAGGRLTEEEEQKKLAREREAIRSVIENFTSTRLGNDNNYAIAPEKRDAIMTTTV